MISKQFWDTNYAYKVRLSNSFRVVDHYRNNYDELSVYSPKIIAADNLYNKNASVELAGYKSAPVMHFKVQVSGF